MYLYSDPARKLDHLTLDALITASYWTKIYSLSYDFKVNTRETHIHEHCSNQRLKKFKFYLKAIQLRNQHFFPPCICETISLSRSQSTSIQSNRTILSVLHVSKSGQRCNSTCQPLTKSSFWCKSVQINFGGRVFYQKLQINLSYSFTIIYQI